MPCATIFSERQAGAETNSLERKSLMRKLIAVAAGVAVLGWSGMAVANPDPHPTQAPKDAEHKDGEHKDEHKDTDHKGDHKEEHKDDHAAH